MYGQVVPWYQVPFYNQLSVDKYTFLRFRHSCLQTWTAKFDLKIYLNTLIFLFIIYPETPHSSEDEDDNESDGDEGFKETVNAEGRFVHYAQKKHKQHK